MEWISPNQGNILSMIEGNVINPIKIEIGDSENYVVTKVSGNFPEGISLVKKDDGYYIEGSLDLVSETTTYYFTLEAKDLDTDEYIQRWFSITVETKITYWDANNDPNLNIVEKFYFSYEYKLINPEGNEIFKKVYGELPQGMIISESGLLYGLPEENRFNEYKFKIGIYRNDKLIITSPLLSIKVEDISTYDKPIWITDKGIIEYVEYSKYKDITFRAIDPKGGEIIYRKGTNFNLPDGIYFSDNTRTSGHLEGTCQTHTSNKWDFDIIASNGLYDVSRTFTIISNAIDSDYLIEWETNELDNAKIGYNYNGFVKAKSSRELTYIIVEGKLPNGLKMDKNGNIFGNVDFQEIGDYEFVVKVYNDMSFEIKTFSITVEKGLSKDSLDVYLYINKDNQQEYQEMLMKYDRMSAYNSSNPLYKIPSMPKIDICSIKTWDNTLLKYKFEQFNTPIDIIWKEIKKKALSDYDFFYKDFNEINKKSELFDLKLHSDDETIETDRFGNEFKPGYIREKININDVEIIYRKMNPDGSEGEIIEDIENIVKEIDGDEIKYYYIDPETGNKQLIFNPQYYYQGTLLTKDEVENIDNYAEFPNMYVVNPSLDSTNENNYIYIEPISIGRYYEKDTLKIVDINETIYIRKEIIDNKEIFIRYILDNGEEKEVQVVDEENQYCSYDPHNKNNNHYYIDISNYDGINYNNKIDNYYRFNSETVKYQTTSINEIRNVLKEPFNVSRYNGKLWYKIGSQEFVYKKNGDIQDFDFQRYILRYDEKTKQYYADFNGNKIYLYVYRKDENNEFKQVYAEIDGEYKPLIQKASILDGIVDFVFYTVYRKGYNIPFTNALFECEWDENLKLTCEFDEETGIYQWFRIKEIENPYVYYASENTSYGFDRDIVLPNIKEEHIEDGKVIFMNEDILPDYMEGEYKPILPLYFANTNSQNAILKEINAYEKEGHYWYERKFVFYEIHFSPKYNDMDNFTIDFYNHKNENSPEFLLI